MDFEIGLCLKSSSFRKILRNMTPSRASRKLLPRGGPFSHRNGVFRWATATKPTHGADNYVQEYFVTIFWFYRCFLQ